MLAVLPEEGGGHVLFSIKDAHAVKHTVQVGLESDHDVQIIAQDLKAGDEIIVMGSYQLEDGMEVSVQEPHPAGTTGTTAPTTSEAGR